MSMWRAQRLLCMLVSAAGMAHAQAGHLTLPRQVVAGDAFPVQTSGSGKAVLYIVGLGQVVRREVQLGETLNVAAGVLNSAGHYVTLLHGDTFSEDGVLEVTPAPKVASVNFLAKPSRLPVGLHDGISGAVYLFDPYQNLVLKPTQVTFQLSGTNGVAQTRTVLSKNGSAWTQLDSAAKEGAARFSARAGDVSSTRVIQQVPGDPCGLRLSARPDGHNIALQTDPLRDCSGNAVPDGTIVTFTEMYNGTQSTIDVPLKHGVAQAELPAYNGARISAATGVVLGNEIRWSR